MKPIELTEPQRREIERRRKGSLDRRVYQRLTAVLAVSDGRTREDVAELLGISLSQLGEWLRVYRNEGIDALCEVHNKGDPGKLTPGQIEKLKAEAGEGRFRTSDQVRAWILQEFGVGYSRSGVKDLLKRVGLSHHQVTGFLWKGKRKEQLAFVKRVARHKREAAAEGAPLTRRYYVDACHPIWGLDLVYRCWLPVGKRLLVGMGSGRKRMNILGGYCPDDHEYIDHRVTHGNINAEQFINFMRVLRSEHPETERFLLYVDGAAYFHCPLVKEWLRRHPEFRLSKVPAYSPNCNLIERLWKFMKQKALCKWHRTFADMQAAVGRVLNNLKDHIGELRTLMTEKFHIIAEDEVPVEYQEAA